MAGEELTNYEKAGLLAFKDTRNRGAYDNEFYELLCATVPPQPSELDEEIRRAIARFVTEAWTQHMERCRAQSLDGHFLAKAAVTIALLTGYELGRKLQRPLASSQEGTEVGG